MLGGEMPLEVTNMLDPNLHTLGQPSTCYKYAGERLIVWTPVVLESYSPKEGYKWLDDRTSSRGKDIEALHWANSQPNGLGSEKCMAMVEQFGKPAWVDATCQVPRCSICSIPYVQTYYLRGLSQKYGHEYYLSMIMNRNATKVVFEGDGSSQIIWYPLEKKSVVKSFNNDQTIKDITIEGNPFGILQAGKPNQILVFTNVSIRHLGSAINDRLISCLISSATPNNNSHVGMGNVFLLKKGVTRKWIAKMKAMSTCVVMSSLMKTNIEMPFYLETQAVQTK